MPLGPAGIPRPRGGQPGCDPSHAADELLLSTPSATAPPNPASETGTPSPTTYYPAGNGIAANTPSLVQYLSPPADPFNGPATPKITWYPGVLPGAAAGSDTAPGSAPANYQSKLPTVPAGSQRTKHYWVCLRRPANPFAPVSAANPMLVVDALRFPYIDGTVPLTGQGQRPRG